MDNFEKKIKISYINFISSNNQRPNSLKALSKSDDSLEYEELIKSFSSVEQIETDIWISALENAYSNASSDPNFKEYMIRERILSFFYNWIEVLKKDQDFYKYSTNIHSIFEFKSIDDRRIKVKKAFDIIFTPMLEEGFETGEIESRMFVSDYYIDFIFAQAVIITKYWSNDTSEDTENTDEAIEKSVNLVMDLIGPNFTDSAFLLGKFLLQK
ncbi:MULTISPECIES: hypothetical protein [Flammeovirga]|uniref:Tetracyclin repressor-like C-terminal domain-containing protein n=1 Tax=Flammeovirga agarivorans TaxID=2726742 RepID=A0A7X8SM76_9BACT|nr:MULTISPECIES: hypothetical protein [Flammeovirga]NLR92726.1 hypothetical protein [Flammeovirga agarivorans]